MKVRPLAGVFVLFWLAACAGYAPPSEAPGPDGASVAVDSQSPTVAIAGKDLFGANLATSMGMTGTDSRYATMMTTFAKARFGMVRIPLALLSDYYDWQTNSFSTCIAQWQPVARTTFDQLMQQVVGPLKLDTNVTIDYGSNPTCTAGGSASLAAAWVNHANNQMHYGIKYWTIGNEMYWGWPGTPPPSCCTTPDFNVSVSNANDGAAVYAHRVANEFYPLMKAKDPTIQIGVDLVAGNPTPSARSTIWDSTVLHKAKYDFVEVHWYPGPMSDADLLTAGVAYVTSGIAATKSELAAAGRPRTPIYVGEWGISGNAQWSSIVGALFTAMVLGEFEKGGVRMASVWEGWNSGPCFANQTGFYSRQDWSTDSLFEAIDGGTNPACPSAVQPPLGTPFPRADAIAVVQQAFRPGDKIFAPSIIAPGKRVRVYGAKRHSGYGLLLINIGETRPASVKIGLLSDARTFDATTVVYDKAIYDRSKSNEWATPSPGSLGKVHGAFSLTLPPWSVMAVTLSRS